MKKYFLIFLLFFLGACTSTDVKPLISELNTMAADKRYYVAVGDDGQERYGIGRYAPAKESGRKASEQVAQFLTKRKRAAAVARQKETPEAALQSARNLRADYLVYPEVTYWTDPLFFMCERITQPKSASYMDEVDLHLSVYDVRTGRIMNKAHLVSDGCPAVGSLTLGIPIGITTPEGHLKKALKMWWENFEK